MILAKLAQAAGESNTPTQKDIDLLKQFLKSQTGQEPKITKDNYGMWRGSLSPRQEELFKRSEENERLAQEAAKRNEQFREDARRAFEAWKEREAAEKEFNRIRIDKPQINPYLAAVLGLFGPAALLGGLYGTYRSAKEKDLLRSILYGALSGVGGGALYRFHTALSEGLDLPSIWVPLAIGALIGAGGGLGAYGLGRLFG